MTHEELHKSTFHFKGWEKHKSENAFIFSYAIETEKKICLYSEILTFPADIVIDVQDIATRNILDQLSIALGISYYKGALSERIDTHSISLSNDQAAYWNIVYTKGLGELLLRNNMDKSIIATFPISENSHTQQENPSPKVLREETMLGLGGGKDSFVSYETLKKHGMPATFYLIETGKEYNTLRSDVQKLDLPCIYISRELDPSFINDTKVVPFINGHIPISVIYGWIGVLVAYATGKKYISLGNEASAEETTVGEVNHQWSKTIEHEELIRTMIKDHAHPYMTFFSPIRKLTSIHIGKELCAHPQYLKHFSSCSKQFVMQNTDTKRWCGECAKCLGTYILLAPWLGIETTTEIFGENLLTKESLKPILDQLTGKSDAKPFDCVATIEETKACIEAIEKNDTSALDKYLNTNEKLF